MGKKIKLCKDCKWYEHPVHGHPDGLIDLCHCPEVENINEIRLSLAQSCPNLIIGELKTINPKIRDYAFCYNERDWDDGCGEKGKYWQSITPEPVVEKKSFWKKIIDYFNINRGLTMSVKVEKEPDYIGMIQENCCFCRTLTPFWFRKLDVACCEECASRANEEDFPSKKEWIRRERIAAPTYREIQDEKCLKL